MTTPFGDFGAPPDVVAWVSLVLAGVALFVAFRPAVSGAILRAPDRVLVALLAAIAAALSWVYVETYLRGGPRIVDATTYFLQARTLAEGHLGAVVPSPTASFRGRFLLASPDGHTLTGIFPPGYPALLALGFVARAPLAVGPAIAAGLVAVTYALAGRLFDDRRVALLAAALSAVSAVLRYHTADTMSHGWSALLFGFVLWSLLNRSRGTALLAGLALGWLAATRSVTAGAAFAVAVAAVSTMPAPRARLALLVAGAIGPLVLFLVEQRAATGVWFDSSQLAYYALADGPPGCFRYGFGRGIGCVFEHGDFVRAHLAHGYGLVAAVGTTLRRFKMHLADAGNCELFAPVLVYAVVVAFRERRGRLAATALLATVAVYAPFYFDGNYPGGGARLYADALPFEHALLGFGLARLGVARFTMPVCLAGFALHTAYDHRRLAEREGGRPLFEPAALVQAGVRRGLVFVDTDHGFDLGFDPRVPDARDGIVVARLRRDANDAALWEQLGRPPAYVYEQSLAPGAPPARVVALAMEPAPVPRFEAESQWPPLDVQGGYVEPIFPPCASLHRALALRPAGGAGMRVRFEAPLVSSGRYRITTAWVTPASGRARVRVTLAGISWEVALEGVPGTCLTFEGPTLDVSQYADYIDISATSEQVLDYVELVPSGRL